MPMPAPRPSRSSPIRCRTRPTRVLGSRNRRGGPARPRGRLPRLPPARAIGYRVLRQATQGLEAASPCRRPTWPIGSWPLPRSHLHPPSQLFRPIRRKRTGPSWCSMASIAAAASIMILPVDSRGAGSRRRVRRSPRGADDRLPDARSECPFRRSPASDAGTRRSESHSIAPSPKPRSATWDLARSASEPAARISREMLEATTRPAEFESDPRSDGTVAGEDHVPISRPMGLTVSVPSLAPFAPDPSAASAALQQVGDHLADGVRPLSDTARHAFGFLMGSARGSGRAAWQSAVREGGLMRKRPLRTSGSRSRIEHRDSDEP